jgi:guanylate kinase
VTLPSAIILYGPPAAGKDTITAALQQLDSRYVGFGKLKLADEHGDTTRYRLTTEQRLHRLRKQGLVIYENGRYGNRYIVDKPGLDDAFAEDHIPVVHMGQVAGVRALKSYPATWLPVVLWCPRETTAIRARLRGSPDVEARLTAWDETRQDFARVRPDDFHLRIDTDQVEPHRAAKAIDSALRNRLDRVRA